MFRLLVQQRGPTPKTLKVKRGYVTARSRQIHVVSINL